MIRIELARTETQRRAGLALIREYLDSLGVDLSFQDVQEELRTFPGQYAEPEGEILLASEGDTPVGVVALRRFEGSVCEMKRLYVPPRFRGRGIGRALSQRLLRDAAARGYDRMRLDTLPTMDPAIGLYRSLGFREIPPYRFNPVPGALFFEMGLDPGSRSRSPSKR